MTPAQREAAARLVDWLHASGVVNSEVKETIALLRELAAEALGRYDDSKTPNVGIEPPRSGRLE